MNSQSDEINLELTNEEVDDAINFGMTFDDIQDSLQAEDTALPILNTGASLGTCSPTPSFDDESLTSTGSKRSRAEYCSIDDEEDGPHHKRRVNYSNRGGAASADVSGNNSSGENNAALSAIRLDREREGRCPDCGLETHSVERSEKGYKKTPLNVEGEVLDGRCLFCHPLEEGESPKKSEKGASKTAPMDVAGAQKKTLQFDAEMMKLQQNRRAALAAPNHAPIQSRKSPVVRQSGDKKDPRKHSWRERTRMNPNDDNDDNPSVKGSLTDDDVSQYSSRSQISDGIGHLGKAMASGMGMNCTDQPNNTMTRQNSKSPHTSRNSPKGTRDPSSSNATPISYHSNSGNSPLGGSDRANNEQDVPAHVRLAHNKLPSSIYHHHLFPMSKETEQAYIEKTLAYLESGGGDIVDVIAAMRRFPFSLPVQSLCCEKLYVHCFDNDHAHAIVLVGGIRTVIDAMEHHCKDMALQRGCAGIIKHMATASKYNLEMLDKMGAIQVIVNSMRGNAHSPALLESCCWTLATMARGPNPEIKLRIAKAGGVHACMNAVEMYPKNESLLRAAFNALNFFGYNPASHTADVARMQQNQQQQRQIHNQQMQRQQFEQAMIQSGNGRASGGNQHPNQVQQQLQRMMQNNEMQEMNMNQVQQQQLQRMMSKNEMNQMQQNQQQLNEMKQLQQNQQQLLNRQWQQQQQQMLAMSQSDGLPTNEMRMRMQTVNNIGNAQMGNGRSNNSTPGNDGVNFSLGNSNSGRRRM